MQYNCTSLLFSQTVTTPLHQPPQGIVTTTGKLTKSIQSSRPILLQQPICRGAKRFDRATNGCVNLVFLKSYAAFGKKCKIIAISRVFFGQFCPWIEKQYVQYVLLPHRQQYDVAVFVKVPQCCNDVCVQYQQYYYYKYNTTARTDTSI